MLVICLGHVGFSRDVPVGVRGSGRGWRAESGAIFDMLLSPPFLPPPLAGESDDDYLARVMAALPAGEGSFPVGLEMNWHGGMHLAAPAAGGAVRAIADGTVTFVRKPTRRTSDVAHPLNYRGGWTDDGCVVISHQTTIGFDAASSAETTVQFLSIYMHLGAVRTLSVNDKVFRKDELGSVGSMYGVAGRFHLEIVCDDNNVALLTGRSQPQTSVSANGRTDAVFGSIWFFCPAGTAFFASLPKAGQPPPPVALTSAEGFFISMRFSGDDAVFTTHHVDGRTLGAPVPAPGYGANLVTNAQALYPSSPSAGVELLRFGRVLGPDALSPANAPNFQNVALPAGNGFVDLNASTVLRFSDADFPSWDQGFKSGWKLVDGSASPDSRCVDTTIVQALDIDGDLVVKPDEAQQRLSDPPTQAGLARKICKFPSEWETATIDARFGWLQSEKPAKLSAKQFADFRAHVAQLCFWQGTTPGIAANCWHFHPREFIRQFRQCVWLDAFELAQCIPRRNVRLQGTAFVGQAVATFARARARANNWSVGVNLMARKYLISLTPRRLAHLLAQVFDETGFLQFVKEGGGETASYAPYYGRGLIQLTGLRNYRAYGQYRGFPTSNPTTNPTFSALGWDPDVLIATSNTVFNAVTSADTTGFYWATHTPPTDHGNGLSDPGTSVTDMVAVSKFVNGQVPNQNVNGLDQRIGCVIFLKYALLDAVLPSGAAPTESVTFAWRRNSAKEVVLKPDGTPLLKADGTPVPKKFFLSNLTMVVPLTPQRP